MSHKSLLLAFTLSALLVTSGALWWMSKYPAAPSQSITTTQREVDSIKDLIDGEYTFTPVDTSTWKVYRNETAGFEVKIPNDWFCGGVALQPNSNKSFICLEEKLRDKYYAGEFQNIEDYIMVNFPDSEDGTLREYLATRKKDGSKIVGLIVSGNNAVLVDESSLFDLFGKWNFVISTSVKKEVADGFLQTFRFFK